MAQINERAKEIAKKLQRMANDGRGNDNEESNAQRLLEEWLAKNNLTLADLDDDKIETFYFAAYDKMERKFFKQMFFSVVGNDNVSVKDYKPSRGEFGKFLKPGALVIEYKCAKHEHHLVISKMNFFWPHYIKELDVFYSAYIQKNELYSNPEKTRDDGDDEMDLERLQKLKQMMQAVEQTSMAQSLPETIK